jgi:hypothetical protein
MEKQPNESFATISHGFEGAYEGFANAVSATVAKLTGICRRSAEFQTANATAGIFVLQFLSAHQAVCFCFLFAARP